MFSEFFTEVLIYGSLILTSVSVILMLSMLFKDYKDGKLW